MLPINAAIDAVNQGNWSLSIKLRLDTFVNVEKYYSFAKAPADSFAQLAYYVYLFDLNLSSCPSGLNSTNPLIHCSHCYRNTYGSKI